MAGLLVVGVFIFLLIKIIIPSTGHMTHGFIGFYTASLLLVRDELGPQAYDNEWYGQQVQATTGQPIAEILTPSLPTVSLIAIPLISLSPQIARDTWIWLSLLLLLVALSILMATHYKLNQGHVNLLLWLVFIAFALIFPPVAANFYIGQSIILFFCLFALTFFGLVTGRDWLVGLTLGLALILKTTGLALWLLLLIHRRWSALGWGLGTAVGIALLSLPWIGVDTWRAYAQAAWNVTAGPIMAVSAYQTTAGFLAHLFQFDPVWNPNPVIDWPNVARFLTLFITLATITITLWLGRDKSSAVDFFAALVPLSVVLLPVGEEHHFIILLIPIFILMIDLFQPVSQQKIFSMQWILLGIALFLLVAPIPYKHTSLSVGWLALLAYPRLYGAWLVWGVVIWRMILKQYYHQEPQLS